MSGRLRKPPPVDGSDRLLALACQFPPGPHEVGEVRTLLDEITDVEALLRRAEAEGLGGLLYALLRRTEGLARLEPAAAESLRAGYLGTAARNLQIIEGLEPVLERAVAGGLEPVALKGAALLGRVYEDFGGRPMSDVDLWIRSGEREAFAALLEELDFRRDAVYGGTWRRGLLSLDLHTHPLGADRIASRAWLLAAGADELFDRSVPHRVGRARCRRPAPYDEVLLLILHLFKHNAGRLIWLADLERVVAAEVPRERRSELAAHASGLGLERTLARWVYLREEVLALSPPPPEALPPAGDAAPARAELVRLGRLERRLLGRRGGRGRLPEWAPLLLFAPERGRLRQFRYLLETLFPRPGVLREIFPGPPRLPVPLLYLRRGAQLLGWGLSALASTMPFRPRRIHDL